MDPDDRIDPPLKSDEATMLRGFLDYHRDTLRWKVDGLTQAQLAQPHPPTTMTLGGIMKHVALNESGWFDQTFAGRDLMPPFDGIDWKADPDWEWRSAAEDSPEQILAVLDEAVARSDRVIEQALARPSGLDTESVVRSRSGELYTLRWIVLHMLEEYARHNGHADLIRESIDGATGE